MVTIGNTLVRTYASGIDNGGNKGRGRRSCRHTDRQVDAHGESDDYDERSREDLEAMREASHA